MSWKTCVTLCIGNLYLVGAILLLPGFVWIIPTHISEKGFPVFGSMYGTAVKILIGGMSCILSAAIIDLLQCNKGKICGLICQVFAAASILSGCVAFLPEYSLTHPPQMILGMKAPIFGTIMFLIASVLYFAGACMAICGIKHAMASARHAPMLRLQLCAFRLFICTSTLYFANGILPPRLGVVSGWMRFAGSIFLFLAVVILYYVDVKAMCFRRNEQAPALTDGIEASA